MLFPRSGAKTRADLPLDQGGERRFSAKFSCNGQVQAKGRFILYPTVVVVVVVVVLPSYSYVIVLLCVIGCMVM